MNTEERLAYRKRRLREKEKKRKRKQLKIGCFVILAVLLASLILFLANALLEDRDNTVYQERDDGEIVIAKPEIDVQLLTVNPYSRPGTQTEQIRNIVVHYVANPGSTAQQNRDYFEGLKDTGETSSSSNFVIGLEGEIIQCVPTWEIAWASNEANSTSVSIELCHPTEAGEFTDETYESLVHLSAWLCEKFDLTSEDILRHYDITEKMCPLYFVENEDEWVQFKKDVNNQLIK